MKWIEGADFNQPLVQTVFAPLSMYEISFTFSTRHNPSWKQPDRKERGVILNSP